MKGEQDSYRNYWILRGLHRDGELPPPEHSEPQARRTRERDAQTDEERHVTTNTENPLTKIIRELSTQTDRRIEQAKREAQEAEEERLRAGLPIIDLPGPKEYALWAILARVPTVIGLAGAIWCSLTDHWPLIPLAIGISVIGGIVVAALINRTAVIGIGIGPAIFQRALLMAWIVLVSKIFWPIGYPGLLLAFPVWFRPIVLISRHQIDNSFYNIIPCCLMAIVGYAVGCLTIPRGIFAPGQFLTAVAVLSLIEMRVTVAFLRSEERSHASPNA